MTDQQRDAFRELWNLSMHGKVPIWVGRAIQHYVMHGLGVTGPVEVQQLLYDEDDRELTADEVREIRDREARVERGDFPL